MQNEHEFVLAMQCRDGGVIVGSAPDAMATFAKCKDDPNTALHPTRLIASRSNDSPEALSEIIVYLMKQGYDSSKIRILPYTTFAEILPNSTPAEILKILATSQRAKKASKKKKEVVKKAPKAAAKAKTSRNPSERVTVSTRITRTQVLSSPSNNLMTPLLLNRYYSA